MFEDQEGIANLLEGSDGGGLLLVLRLALAQLQPRLRRAAILRHRRLEQQHRLRQVALRQTRLAWQGDNGASSDRGAEVATGNWV